LVSRVRANEMSRPEHGRKGGTVDNISKRHRVLRPKKNRQKQNSLAVAQ